MTKTIIRLQDWNPDNLEKLTRRTNVDNHSELNTCTDTCTKSEIFYQASKMKIPETSRYITIMWMRMGSRMKVRWEWEWENVSKSTEQRGIEDRTESGEIGWEHHCGYLLHGMESRTTMRVYRGLSVRNRWWSDKSSKTWRTRQQNHEKENKSEIEDSNWKAEHRDNEVSSLTINMALNNVSVIYL